MTPGNRTHYGEYTKISTKIRTLDPILIPFRSKLEWENIKSERIIASYIDPKF